MASNLAVVPLIEVPSDKGHVTALHADGLTAVVGTSLGWLLRVPILADLSLAESPACELDLSGKKKSRPAVRCLTVLADSRIVIALCNGLVSVHALDSLASLCVLNNERTKAETFCCNVDAGVPRVALFVSEHSSILLYRLGNPVQLYRELAVRVAPSAMIWQGECLALTGVAGVTLLDALACHTLYEHAPAENTRVAEAFENQRWAPFAGFRASLLPTDLCGPWCDAHSRPVPSLVHV